MHKTGTSSIQNYLQTNNQHLGKGIYYADLGSSNHTGPLAFALKNNPNEFYDIAVAGLTSTELEVKINEYQKRLRDALETDFQTIIFSAEGIISLSIDELFAFKNMLIKYVDKIVCIAYVRKPVSFIESAYQQKLKLAYTKLVMDDLYPNYRSRFAKFEKVFGGVKYKIFEAEKLKKYSVVNDFCSEFNIQYKIIDSNVNESLSLLGVKFLHAFQKHRVDGKRQWSEAIVLEKALSKLNDIERFKLTERQMIVELERKIKDIHWMEKRLGQPIYSPNNINVEVRSINLSVISTRERDYLVSILEKERQLADLLFKEYGLDIPHFLEKYFRFCN